jgi:tRNA-binding protein
MNPAPIKPLISTSDLDKIDVRVGTILAVEDVARSEKLVRLRVDFGDHALHSRRHEKVAAISKGD